MGACCSSDDYGGVGGRTGAASRSEAPLGMPLSMAELSARRRQAIVAHNPNLYLLALSQGVAMDATFIAQLRSLLAYGSEEGRLVAAEMAAKSHHWRGAGGSSPFFTLLAASGESIDYTASAESLAAPSMVEAAVPPLLSVFGPSLLLPRGGRPSLDSGGDYAEAQLQQFVKAREARLKARRKEQKEFEKDEKKRRERAEKALKKEQKRQRREEKKRLKKPKKRSRSGVSDNNNISVTAASSAEGGEGAPIAGPSPQIDVSTVVQSMMAAARRRQRRQAIGRSEAATGSSSNSSLYLVTPVGCHPQRLPCEGDDNDNDESSSLSRRRPLWGYPSRPPHSSHPHASSSAAAAATAFSLRDDVEFQCLRALRTALLWSPSNYGALRSIGVAEVPAMDFFLNTILEAEVRRRLFMKLLLRQRLVGDAEEGLKAARLRRGLELRAVVRTLSGQKKGGEGAGGNADSSAALAAARRRSSSPHNVSAATAVERCAECDGFYCAVRSSGGDSEPAAAVALSSSSATAGAHALMLSQFPSQPIVQKAFSPSSYSACQKPLSSASAAVAAPDSQQQQQRHPFDASLLQISYLAIRDATVAMAERRLLFLAPSPSSSSAALSNASKRRDKKEKAVGSPLSPIMRKGSPTIQRAEAGGAGGGDPLAESIAAAGASTSSDALLKGRQQTNPIKEAVTAAGGGGGSGNGNGGGVLGKVAGKTSSSTHFIHITAKSYKYPFMLSSVTNAAARSAVSNNTSTPPPLHVVIGNGGGSDTAAVAAAAATAAMATRRRRSGTGEPGVVAFGNGLLTPFVTAAPPRTAGGSVVGATSSSLLYPLGMETTPAAEMARLLRHLPPPPPISPAAQLLIFTAASAAGSALHKKNESRRRATKAALRAARILLPHLHQKAEGLLLQRSEMLAIALEEALIAEAEAAKQRANGVEGGAPEQQQRAEGECGGGSTATATPKEGAEASPAAIPIHTSASLLSSTSNNTMLAVPTSANTNSRLLLSATNLTAGVGGLGGGSGGSAGPATFTLSALPRSRGASLVASDGSGGGIGFGNAATVAASAVAKGSSMLLPVPSSALGLNATPLITPREPAEGPSSPLELHSAAARHTNNDGGSAAAIAALKDVGGGEGTKDTAAIAAAAALRLLSSDSGAMVGSDGSPSSSPHFWHTFGDLNNDEGGGGVLTSSYRMRRLVSVVASREADSLLCGMLEVIAPPNLSFCPPRPASYPSGIDGGAEGLRQIVELWDDATSAAAATNITSAELGRGGGAKGVAAGGRGGSLRTNSAAIRSLSRRASAAVPASGGAAGKGGHSNSNNSEVPPSISPALRRLPPRAKARLIPINTPPHHSSTLLLPTLGLALSSARHPLAPAAQLLLSPSTHPTPIPPPAPIPRDLVALMLKGIAVVGGFGLDGGRNVRTGVAGVGPAVEMNRKAVAQILGQQQQRGSVADGVGGNTAAANSNGGAGAIDGSSASDSDATKQPAALMAIAPSLSGGGSVGGRTPPRAGTPPASGSNTHFNHQQQQQPIAGSILKQTSPSRDLTMGDGDGAEGAGTPKAIARGSNGGGASPGAANSSVVPPLASLGIGVGFGSRAMRHGGESGDSLCHEGSATTSPQNAAGGGGAAPGTGRRGRVQWKDLNNLGLDGSGTSHGHGGAGGATAGGLGHAAGLAFTQQQHPQPINTSSAAFAALAASSSSSPLFIASAHPTFTTTGDGGGGAAFALANRSFSLRQNERGAANSHTNGGLPPLFAPIRGDSAFGPPPSSSSAIGLLLSTVDSGVVSYAAAAGVGGGRSVGTAPFSPTEGGGASGAAYGLLESSISVGGGGGFTVDANNSVTAQGPVYPAYYNGGGGGARGSGVGGQSRFQGGGSYASPLPGAIIDDDSYGGAYVGASASPLASHPQLGRPSAFAATATGGVTSGTSPHQQHRRHPTPSLSAAASDHLLPGMSIGMAPLLSAAALATHESNNNATNGSFGLSQQQQQTSQRSNSGQHFSVIPATTPPAGSSGGGIVAGTALAAAEDDAAHRQKKTVRIVLGGVAATAHAQRDEHDDEREEDNVRQQPPLRNPTAPQQQTTTRHAASTALGVGIGWLGTAVATNTIIDEWEDDAAEEAALAATFEMRMRRLTRHEEGRRQRRTLRFRAFRHAQMAESAANSSKKKKGGGSSSDGGGGGQPSAASRKMAPPINDPLPSVGSVLATAGGGGGGKRSAAEVARARYLTTVGGGGSSLVAAVPISQVPSVAAAQSLRGSDPCDEDPSSASGGTSSLLCCAPPLEAVRIAMATAAATSVADAASSLPSAASGLFFEASVLATAGYTAPAVDAEPQQQGFLSVEDVPPLLGDYLTNLPRQQRHLHQQAGLTPPLAMGAVDPSRRHERADMLGRQKQQNTAAPFGNATTTPRRGQEGGDASNIPFSEEPAVVTTAFIAPLVGDDDLLWCGGEGGDCWALGGLAGGGEGEEDAHSLGGFDALWQTLHAIGM